MNHDPNNPTEGAAREPDQGPERNVQDEGSKFSPEELAGGAEMDALLRSWHSQNRAAAAEGRDRLLAALARERGAASDAVTHGATVRVDRDLKSLSQDGNQDQPTPFPLPLGGGVEAGSRHAHQRRAQRSDRWRRGEGGAGPGGTGIGGSGAMSFGRYALLAAAMIALAVLIPNLVPTTGPRGGGGGASLFESAALASGTVLAPEGGLLEARDERGDVLGPCVLKHTDVDAKISGRFARVSVTQKYRNPHKQKIEAVYTFPLPHDAAVDRLKMRIGDRVIVGQVRERDTAREMYEAARDQGRVASLLEQERPNIFTQSVANIEPGSEIEIEISYVQTIEQTRDDAVSSTGGAGSMGQGGGGGEFTFVFPMTVSPRYIPVDGRWGGDASDARVADASSRQSPHFGTDRAASDTRERKSGHESRSGLVPRKGLVLRAPATIERMVLAENAATPFLPTPSELARMLAQATPVADSYEQAKDPTATPPAVLAEAKPWLTCEAVYPDGSAEFVQITSEGVGQINGRWFSLSGLRTFAHRNTSDQSRHDADAGPTSSSQQPGAPFAKPTPGVPDADRITPTPVRPPTRAGHEVSIRVHLDTGGPGIVGLSAGSHPIVRSDLRKREEGLASEATVTLMSDNALTGGVIPNSDFVLRWSQTGDTVQESVFTHTGAHGNFLGILLQPPARVTNPEVAVPRELVFVVDTSGSMRGKPLEAAKEVMERLLATARARDTFNIITFAGRTSILWDRPRPATAQNQADAMAWLQSQEGGGGTEMMKAIEAALRQEQALRQDEAVPEPGLVQGDEPVPDREVRPLRLAVFLTDGEVGNDMAIIDAVRRHRATTRVFTFGVGTSVNRYLLAGMATAGGGASEFVQLQHNGEGVSASDLEAVIGRFASRATTPLLTDIRVEATPGLNLMDFEPAIGAIPDVFDHSPVMLLCRYPDIAEPVRGEVTVSGWTGQGAWRRRIAVVLPAAQRRDDDGMGAGDADAVAAQQSAALRGGAVASGSGHDVLATLWARRRIESLMNSDLTSAQHGDIDPETRAKIVTLGETFSIMSAYTSFVAIDALRITVDGRPLLVHVPIELPAQTDWENYFGLDEASLAKGIDDATGGENEKAAREQLHDVLIQYKDGDGGSSETNAADPMAAGIGGAVQSAPGAPGEPTGGAGGAGGAREAAPAKKRVAKDEQKEEVTAGAPLIRGGDGRNAGDKPQTGRGTSLAVTSASPSPVADKSKVAAPPPPPTPPPPAMEAAPIAASIAPMPAPVAGVSASPADARQRGEGGGSRARAAGGSYSEPGSASPRAAGTQASARVDRSAQLGASRLDRDDFSNGFGAAREKLVFPATTEALSREDAPSLDAAALTSDDRAGAPPALPSQLLAAAEVIRGVETARRTGQVDEIDDGRAIVAVQRSQRLAPTQSESLLRRQGQSIAQQRVVQNYNRVAMSQAPVVSGDAADAQQKTGQRQSQNQTQYGLPSSVPSQARAEIPQELAQIEQQARAEFDRYARLVNKLDPRLAPALDPAWREEYRHAMKTRTEAGRSLDRQATAKSTPRDTASNAADHSLDDAALLPAFDVIDDPALVAVRLTTYARTHVDALRNAGLEVLSISRSDGVIIGRLRLADVERVASLDEVAFVQLTDVLEAE